MYKEVDARGMNCPLPVIETKKALEEISKGRVTTIVDNEVAKENVSRLAKSLDCKIDIKEIRGSFYIDIFKESGISEGTAINLQASIRADKDLVILISNDKFGKGSDELGRLLMKGYIYALTEIIPLPKTLILLNGGVNLAIEGSQSIKDLCLLETQGVEILSCGTCLDYFKVKNKLMVGGISNMYTIVEKLNNAKNTIIL